MTPNLGDIGLTLALAHFVGDYWAQTHHQATHKYLPGWVGWRSNLAHVATYHAVMAGMLAVAALALGWDLSPAGVAAGLAVSAVTHAWADRRHTLERLAERLGKGEFYRLAIPGLSGAHLLDQAWHLGWVWVAAVVMTAA
jgi:hypothetical protein